MIQLPYWTILCTGACCLLSVMIWNSPIVLPFYAKNIILGIVGWIIIFSLIQSGLKQIKVEKTIAMQQNDTRR